MSFLLYILEQYYHAFVMNTKTYNYLKNEITTIFEEKFYETIKNQ